MQPISSPSVRRDNVQFCSILFYGLLLGEPSYLRAFLSSLFESDKSPPLQKPAVHPPEPHFNPGGYYMPNIHEAGLDNAAAAAGFVNPSIFTEASNFGNPDAFLPPDMSHLMPRGFGFREPSMTY